MLFGLFVLLACQLAGETIVRLLGLPVPGPVPASSSCSPSSPRPGGGAARAGRRGMTGGDPALTAVFVISTGIVGAILVTPLMNALRIRDYAARGFAAGLASHGIGTARAFQVDGVAGTFAALATALNGLLNALLVPVAAGLLR